MTVQRDQPVAETFVELADTLVDDFDLLDFLELLAHRATELLNVSVAAVILSDQRGGWRPTASSSEEARLMELFSLQAEEGPSQECVTVGEPVTSSDVAAEAARWPHFADKAGRAGLHAACAIPMRLREEVIGSLSLLSTESTGLDEDTMRIGQALADMAATGLLQQRAIRRTELMHEQLQAALQHRKTIEQAKGVLAEHGNLTMQESFELLRDYARAGRQPLSELARAVAERTVDPRDVLERHAVADPSDHE